MTSQPNGVSVIKCYTSDSHIGRSALKIYINHMRGVIKNCTMKDARNMAIEGIMLAIAAIYNLLGID
jgi:hypothetical protein